MLFSDLPEKKRADRRKGTEKDPCKAPREMRPHRFTAQIRKILKRRY